MPSKARRGFSSGSSIPRDYFFRKTQHVFTQRPPSGKRHQPSSTFPERREAKSENPERRAQSAKVDSRKKRSAQSFSSENREAASCRERAHLLGLRALVMVRPVTDGRRAEAAGGGSGLAARERCIGAKRGLRGERAQPQPWRGAARYRSLPPSRN